MNTPRRVAAAVLLSVCAFTRTSLFAQTSITSAGNPQNATVFPVEHGFVNLGDGNLHLAIPIASPPQRGDLSVPAYLVYDSAIWQIENDPTAFSWYPISGGWSLQYGSDNGSTASIHSYGCSYDASITIYVYTAVQWTDYQNTLHTFPIKTVQTNGCSTSPYADTPSAGAFASDASGYYGSISSYDQLNVWDAKGTLVASSVIPSVGSSDFVSADRNGNEVRYGIDGVVSSDTMGHTPVQENVVQTDGTGAPKVIDIVVPVANGQSATYVLTYTTINTATAFDIPPISVTSGGTTYQYPVQESGAVIRVVSSLKLPDGSLYSFSYDQACVSQPCGTQPTVGYGLLTGVTLPHGGTVSYKYSSDAKAGTLEPARWVSEHTGSTGTTDFAYAYVGAYTPTSETGGYNCGEITNTQTDPLLTINYVFTDCGGSIQAAKVIASPTGNPNQVDRVTLLGYDFSNPCQNDACTGAQWITLTGSTTIVPSSGSVSGILSGVGGTGLIQDTQISYAVQGSGTISSVKQWDYRSGAYPTSLPDSPAGNPKREVDKTFGYSVNNALYPTDILTKDSTGTTVAEVQYTYDEPSYFTASPSGVPNHDNSLAAANRGNATTISQIPHGTGSLQPITSHIKYDDTGSVVAMTDGNGNPYTLGYDATDTFPQTISRPSTQGLNGTSVAHTTQRSLDFNTGQLLSTTDENGQVTTLQYDLYGRLSNVLFSNGGNQVTLKSLSYPNYNEVDAQTLQVQNAYANASITSSVVVDGYGRTVKKTQAGVSSDIAYNSQGLLQSVSNPHLTSPSMTDGAMSYAYDEVGRILNVTLPNGASQTTYTYGLDTVNKVTTVTITDPLQNQHQQNYDAFGDLNSVLEPDGNGNLTWLTNYLRTDLGFLKEIDQEGGSSDPTQWRRRYFAYDGLGRLYTESTPEAGQYTYTYDSDGNVKTFSNQNTSNNTVAYTYDALNRLKTKLIAGGSSYYYNYDAQDLSGDPYGVGRLTSVSDGVSIGSRYTHDAMGRIISEADRRPSNCGYTYTVQASYDYVGNLLALTYPDGRTVQWVYDLLNRPTEEVNTYWNTDQVNVPYFAYATYYPTGQMSSVYQGSGVSLTAGVDPNGNVTSLAYANNGLPLLTRSYTWASNAANLTAITDSATGRTQGFTYDHLNRLLTATDSGTTGSGANPSLPNIPSSSVSFNYDQWGNLQQTGPFSFNPSIGANNQVNSSSVGYDSAGNLTSDGIGDNYTYRADGHIVSSNGTAYSYDPLDQRVVKVGSATTDYLYFGGTLIAKRDAGSGNWTDLFYGTNGLLGEVPGTETANPIYRITDQVNSLAQTTDANGNVLGGVTMQPFGQTLANTTGDSFTFTGLEQDTESSNVNTTFREYSPTQGRWLSPDPYDGSYDLTNPQSLNRYVYALNSPETLVDSTGLDSESSACTGLCLYYFGGGTITGGGYGGWTSGDGSGGWSFLNDQTTISIFGGNSGPGPNPSATGIRSLYHYDAPSASTPSTSSKLLDYAQTTFRGFGLLPFGPITDVANIANVGIDLLRGNTRDLALDSVVAIAGIAPGGADVVRGIEVVDEAAELATTVKSANQLGREGEEAVRAMYDIGEKPAEPILMNGRPRIPDGITDTTLSEVKNVKSLSLTQQLRDNIYYAQETGRRFDLYVRKGASLSGPLEKAISNGFINHIPFIP